MSWKEELLVAAGIWERWEWEELYNTLERWEERGREQHCGSNFTIPLDHGTGSNTTIICKTWEVHELEQQYNTRYQDTQVKKVARELGSRMLFDEKEENG